MTKSQTAKAATQTATHGANLAQSQVTPSRMDASHLIDENTRGVLVLFPYKPKEGEVAADKEFPAMTGHIDTRNAKVPVAAFAKITDEGREYLSLSIGFINHEHISGALFRQEQQDPTNGKWEVAPGKGNDRYGIIQKQVKEGADYRTVFELRFYGGRKLSGLNVPYIKAQVYPRRKEGDQPVNDQVMDGCF